MWQKRTASDIKRSDPTGCQPVTNFASPTVQIFLNVQDGACPTSLATVDGWCTTLLDSKSRCSTSSFEHGIAGEVRRSSGTRGTVTYCDLISVNTCQYTCPDTCQYSQQITTNHNSLQILCSLGTACFPSREGPMPHSSSQLTLFGRTARVPPG